MMSDSSQPPLSKEQAARLIFATAAPSSMQIAKVHELMRRGHLQTAPDRHDLTTRQAVAEYLAAQEWKRQAQKRSTENQAGGATRWAAAARGAELPVAAQRSSAAGHHLTGTGQSAAGATFGPARAAAAGAGQRGMQRNAAAQQKLKLVYRQLLVDYFLGVLVNRQTSRATAAFRQVVAISRVALLLVLMLLCGWTVHLALRSGPRLAVKQWLAENRQAVELVRWEPAHARPGGTAVRVVYRHRGEDGQFQAADRVFVVEGRQIKSIVLPDEQDDLLANRPASH